MSPSPISLKTAVLLLAYCQHYTPKYLPGRYLPLDHIRRLAHWIGWPNQGLRSLRSHPPLAAHFVLLQAAKLLTHNQACWYCQPQTYTWLKAPPEERSEHLLAAIDHCQWTTVIQEMRLQKTLAYPYATYVRQHLQKNPDNQHPPAPLWLEQTATTWQLQIDPSLLPAPLTFHLLQLGEWDPGRPVTITPLSIAQASQRGYSLLSITHTLTNAAQQPLTPQHQTQLIQWYQDATAITLQPVYLLSVQQPHQLNKILQNTRLRRRVTQQLSPRHAIVSPAITHPLQKWLNKQQTPLQTLQFTTANSDAVTTSTAYHWLALRLLIDLGQLIPLSYPPPAALLNEISAVLPAQIQSEMEQFAQQTLDDLRQAIRGRDAFFPAPLGAAPNPEHRQLILHAIASERPLHILYQGLTDTQPIPRHIQPLRLEDRGPLSYLHAYCYNAAAERTFRLDRIKEARPGSPQKEVPEQENTTW